MSKPIEERLREAVLEIQTEIGGIREKNSDPVKPFPPGSTFPTYFEREKMKSEQEGYERALNILYKHVPEARDILQKTKR